MLVEKKLDERVSNMQLGDINTSILKLKLYLKQNQISLYEHFKLWDFNKNNRIKIKHLKDALNVKFFNFDEEIRDTLINLSYRFITEDKLNIDEVYVNYEDLCYELID